MNRQSTYIDQELEWGLCNHFEDIFHLKWSRSISRSTVIYSRIQEKSKVVGLCYHFPREKCWIHMWRESRKIISHIRTPVKYKAHWCHLIKNKSIMLLT
jgi:hypothetical protein